jgi:hypothetical protein
MIGKRPATIIPIVNLLHDSHCLNTTRTLPTHGLNEGSIAFPADEPADPDPDPDPDALALAALAVLTAAKLELTAAALASAANAIANCTFPNTLTQSLSYRLVTLALYALFESLHTALTQPVSTSSTSAGGAQAGVFVRHVDAAAGVGKIDEEEAVLDASGLVDHRGERGDGVGRG